MSFNLSDQLLKLYELACRSDLVSFEHLALRQLGELIGFNGAIWGEGVAQPDAGIRIDRATLVDRSQSLLADYASLPIVEPATRKFLEHPECLQVINVEHAYRPRQLQPVRDMLYAHDVGHFLLKGARSTSGTLIWITAYRAPSEAAFSSQEGHCLSELLPHWIQAREICRVHGAHKTLPSNHAPGNHPCLRDTTTEAPITERQKEVLTLLGIGFTYQQIARHLDISAHTVKEHARNIYQRLGVQNRSEAAFEARVQGLIA